MGENNARRPLREWLGKLPPERGERLLDAINPKQSFVFFTVHGIPVRVWCEGGRIVLEAASGRLHVSSCGAFAQVVAVPDPDPNH